MNSVGKDGLLVLISQKPKREPKREPKEPGENDKVKKTKEEREAARALKLKLKEEEEQQRWRWYKERVCVFVWVCVCVLCEASVFMCDSLREAACDGSAAVLLVQTGEVGEVRHGGGKARDCVL